MYQKIVLAGGSGFLGKVLVNYYKDKTKEIVVLTRKLQTDIANIRFELWDGKNEASWTNALENSDLLINLSGKNVNCRYTPENQKEIIQSRVEPTEALGRATQKLKNPPKLWINSGSATVYRHAEDHFQDEENGEIGTGFSIEVCKAWEASFWKWETPATRKVVLRIGMVLGREDSVFPYLKKLVYCGLGGQQGHGSQYISWIHEQDFARTTEWILKHEALSGTFNCTAPYAATNKEFMHDLRKTFGIPIGISSPKWLLEIGAAIIGTETELILKSRWVYPKRLLDSGFQFSFPEHKAAIHELASVRI